MVAIIIIMSESKKMCVENESYPLPELAAYD